MSTFKLIGLPEAMLGQTFVKAESFSDLLNRFPILKSIKQKLVVNENLISGFDACDG